MQCGQMKRIWHHYIRSGFGLQIGVSLVLVILVTALFAAVLFFVNRESNVSLLSLVSDLAFDNPTGDVSKTSKSIYQSSLILILAVWQAVFLARLITRPHDFRFSQKMALYPYNKLKGRSSSPMLVFRLMNDGISDLYNVEIDATLIVFNPRTQVIQHFRCKVINNRIPVFRRNMPFWIAIETGEVLIKWGDDSLALDRCFLFNVNRKNHEGIRIIDRDYVRAVSEEHQIWPGIFAISVYVQGHDIDLDQQKAANHDFILAEIEDGFFEDIAPKRVSGTAIRRARPDFFDRAEIDRKFDVILAVEN